MTNIKRFEKLFNNVSKRSFKNLSQYEFANIYKENLTSDQNLKYNGLINDLTTTEMMHHIPGAYSKPYQNFYNIIFKN